MTSTEARRHNEAFPFTVAAANNARSFPTRSFATLDEARTYAKAQNPRPWVIADAEGAAIAWDNGW